jgi:hypothetical protein
MVEKIEQSLDEEYAASVTEDELKEISEGIPLIEELLAQEPSLKADIETVIREHIRKPITISTLGVLASGLSHYMDYTIMDYLLRILTGSENYIKEVEKLTSRQTWKWLRYLMATYGVELNEARTISGQNEDSWREIFRHVNFDTVTKNWTVTLEIRKYNGEKMVLNETVPGALSLAWSIIAALNTIPPEVAPELVDRDSISTFLADVVEFSNICAPNLLNDLAGDNQFVEKGDSEGED